MKATVLGIISCIIWSSAVLVSSLLAAGFGSLRAASFELLIAGIFLLAVGFCRGELSKIKKHSLRCQLSCGLFWVLNLSFFWLAVGAVKTNGELLVVGLINYLWPSLTLLLAVPILKKRPTWWLIPGLIAVIGGVVLGKLSTTPGVTVETLFEKLNLVAYLFALCAALAWALYSNLSRRLSHPDGGSSVPVYMLAGSMVLYFGSSLTEPEHFPMLKLWSLLICWALSSGFAYLFWDIGMRKGNVVAISTTSMLIPLFSTIITAALSGAGISIELIVAAGLVVAGSSMCRKGVV